MNKSTISGHLVSPHTLVSPHARDFIVLHSQASSFSQHSDLALALYALNSIYRPHFTCDVHYPHISNIFTM